MASYSTKRPSSSPAQERSLSLLETVLYLAKFLANFAVMLLSATVIHRYGANKNAIKHFEQTLFTRALPVPAIFNDVESALFIFYCLAFAFALRASIRLQKDDTHQTLFLFGGLFVAQIADGLYTGLCTAGGVYLFLLKSFIPITISMAVVLSALFHASIRVCSGTEMIADDQGVEYREEKVGDMGLI